MTSPMATRCGCFRSPDLKVSGARVTLAQLWRRAWKRGTFASQADLKIIRTDDSTERPTLVGSDHDAL